MVQYSMSGTKVPINKPVESSRNWVSGLVVMVAIAVSFVGFARLSVGWTLAISTVVLIGLVGTAAAALASADSRGGG